ncbi:hypothetical protein BO71DRAFT_132646 [Aspergillus ellipticus CBS 707.79]|uniref:Uncharacterized protein n=1 Tax=Aspergillus ellipticus CBS 707.79 TaxID=1448320 RepID=A0A319CTH5_9EURO|nr:hypothetical protein BO71DRAFT_132646 [Aspergillus ellipticus CBS 707.79]
MLFPNLNVLDLELIHHYTTLTAFTFSRQASIQSLWRLQVPEMAFGSLYTLRAIMCLSALHLAHRKSAMKIHFLARAQYHYECAFQQVADPLGTLVRRNSTTAMVFAIIAFFISCAKPRDSGDLWLAEQGSFPGWLVVLRASNDAIEKAGGVVTGPLAPIMNIRGRVSELRNQEATYEMDFLVGLQDIVERHPGNVEELPVYRKAVQELSWSFAVALRDTSGSCEMDYVLCWLLDVSADYLMLLREQAAGGVGDPRALLRSAAPAGVYVVDSGVHHAPEIAHLLVAEGRASLLVAVADGADWMDAMMSDQVSDMAGSDASIGNDYQIKQSTKVSIYTCVDVTI